MPIPLHRSYLPTENGSGDGVPGHEMHVTLLHTSPKNGGSSSTSAITCYENLSYFLSPSFSFFPLCFVSQLRSPVPHAAFTNQILDRRRKSRRVHGTTIGRPINLYRCIYAGAASV